MPTDSTCRSTALSGGERRRVELARILFAGSDLLLLDEPTNHLDNDAKQWLMGFLRSYRGALLVISHDLELLDASITRVLHLDEGDVIEYKGTYSQYRVAREADEDPARPPGPAPGRGDRATRPARRQHARPDREAGQDRQVDRHPRGEAASPTDHRTQARAQGGGAVPGSSPVRDAVVLEADALTKGYGGPTVFDDVTFAVERGERLLVMGLNGAGKTTLMRILAGQTDADLGTWSLGHGVSAGYYAQEHEGIRAGRTVIDHLTTVGLPESQLRTLLGTFGLFGDVAHQDAGTLCGGEKTKLALAQLVTGRHNLLLLDEPTNNLDPPSRDAIGAALADWPGSMVIVSHDPEFVARLEPQRVLMMPEGDLDYWSDDLLDLVALA